MTDKFVSILASGTGGHVYPAYTIANEFIKQGYKIIWIGTKDGIENTVVKNKSITIKHISSTGIRGKSILKKIVGILLLFKSIFQTYSILKQHKPKLTYFLKIQRILHEQNSIAGTANKINFFFAKQVFETFPNSFGKVDKKIIHSGNPIREVFLNLIKPEDRYMSSNINLNI